MVTSAQHNQIRLLMERRQQKGYILRKTYSKCFLKAKRCFDLLHLQCAVRSHMWPFRTFSFAVYPISNAHFASSFRKLPFRRLPIPTVRCMGTSHEVCERRETFLSRLTHCAKLVSSVLLKFLAVIISYSIRRFYANLRHTSQYT